MTRREWGLYQNMRIASVLYLPNDNLPVSPRVERVLAVANAMPPRVITVGFRAVAMPLVSLLLLDYCRLGGMVETESEYGRQVSGQLQILVRGQQISVAGAVVPLVGRPDLILPEGFLVRD